MLPHIADLLKKYKSKGALIDTNLMLLIVVGGYNEDRIDTFKNTRARGYRIADYRYLMQLIKRFDRLVTTPNVLTEVDNLSRQMDSREYEELAASMRQICGTLFEEYRPSSTALGEQLYPQLGLTDQNSFALAQQEYLLITDDFRLANRLEKLGKDVININHIRGYYS